MKNDPRRKMTANSSFLVKFANDDLPYFKAINAVRGIRARKHKISSTLISKIVLNTLF